jgi:hypothetical protein
MADFKAYLRTQIKFINNSCKSYDQGDVDEAVRIAVALRVLFHDSGSSTSLLSHLQSKSVLLRSTAAPFVEDLTFPNLYLIELKASLVADNIRCHCVPLLDTAMRHEDIAFEEWWQKEPIIEHKEPPSNFTRKQLILTATNKDGGAHVDAQQDPIYDRVRRGSGIELEFTFKPESGRPPLTLPFENIHYASLRQIGYEVLNSPALLALA